MNQQAVEHNMNVINKYGPVKFSVVHSGGLVGIWWANNRAHLDLLLRIEKNMGYMLSVDEVLESYAVKENGENGF